MTLIMVPSHLKPVSIASAQHQGPGPGAPTWNAAIVNVIS